MSKLKKDIQSRNGRLDRIQSRLLEQPETIHLEIGGKTYPFLLGVYGARLAREKGEDPIPIIFKGIKTIAPAFAAMNPGETPEPAIVLAVLEKVLTGELLRDLAVIVWSGLLPFEPELLLEEVEIMLTPKALKDIVSEVYPKLVSYAEDQVEEPKAPTEKEEETVGN